MRRGKLAAAFFAALMVLGFGASADAVDGTIEINQAKILANGGFGLFTVGASGSYRLTGNLAVPTGLTGLSVTASYVTIDLNGFSIIGAAGSLGGVVATTDAVVGTTVENGTVKGFINGVFLRDKSLVKSVRADSNSNTGITVGSSSLVLHNIISGSTTGIFAPDATTGYGENLLNNGTNVVLGTSMKNNVCTVGGVTSTC